MTAVSNPFTMVHDALVSLAKAHVPLTALVRISNWITFSGTTPNRDPIKDTVQAGDLPELRLVAAGFDPHMYVDSTSGKIIRRYQWQLATGEQQYDQPGCLFDVEWELLRALNGWQAVLQALTWGTSNTAFCRQMTMGQTRVSEGVSNADLNRGIKGWSAIWECEVLLWFPLADLQPVTS